MKEFIYVPDVTQEKDIHYFIIPKLGSYFIVNFEIKNYLTLDIFNDSTEKRIEYY